MWRLGHTEVRQGDYRKERFIAPVRCVAANLAMDFFTVMPKGK